jgi:hypothetical protein
MKRKQIGHFFNIFVSSEAVHTQQLAVPGINLIIMRNYSECGIRNDEYGIKKRGNLRPAIRIPQSAILVINFLVVSLTSQGCESRIEASKKRGGVAQLVRARGSYPRRPGFESLHRHSSPSNTPC